MFGFGDKAGSLEVGREAVVVVWTGDPLQTSSWPAAIFIAGPQQPQTSSGLQLRGRYSPQETAAAP